MEILQPHSGPLNKMKNLQFYRQIYSRNAKDSGQNKQTIKTNNKSHKQTKNPHPSYWKRLKKKHLFLLSPSSS